MDDKVLLQLFRARHLTDRSIKPFTIVSKYFLYVENQKKEKKKNVCVIKY